MKKTIPSILFLILLSGCLGPPADIIHPDEPNNTDKADPALVQECKQAFGEFGKKDAVEYGNLYLAFAELITEESDGHQLSWAVSWLEKAKLKRRLQSYPGFREIVLRETGSLQQEAKLDEEFREKIAAIFKRLGLAAREAGQS